MRRLLDRDVDRLGRRRAPPARSLSSYRVSRCAATLRKPTTIGSASARELRRSDRIPRSNDPSPSRTIQPRSTRTLQTRWSVLFAIPSSRAISDSPSGARDARRSSTASVAWTPVEATRTLLCPIGQQPFPPREARSPCTERNPFPNDFPHEERPLDMPDGNPSDSIRSVAHQSEFRTVTPRLSAGPADRRLSASHQTQAHSRHHP